MYDFQNKQEKKLTEFSSTVSDSEYSRIDDVVWKNDSKGLAYLVRERNVNDDPRAILKASVYINNLSEDTETIETLLAGPPPNLLVWFGTKIITASGTGEGGVSKITTINVDNKKISDESILLDKNGKVGLDSVFASPESKKIAIDDQDGFIVLDASTNKEIFNLESETASIVGWTNNSNPIYIDYQANENGKGRIGIYNLQKREFKFALFDEELLINAYPVSGFSDLSAVTAAKLDFDSKTWSFYLLNLDGTKGDDLPFTTNTKQGRVTTISVENF